MTLDEDKKDTVATEPNQVYNLSQWGILDGKNQSSTTAKQRPYQEEKLPTDLLRHN